MKFKQSPAWDRGLAILCCIVAMIWPVVFVGCQRINEPPPPLNSNDGSGSSSVVQKAVSLPVEAGPILTVTNEYMDPVTSSRPGGFMRIPDGVPLTFCWTAEEAPGGGSIAAYRYGWDVFDPDDPADWDVEFTAYDGARVCSPSRAFNTSGVHLFMVEVIDDAGASSRIVIIISIGLGPSSFDVVPGTCKNPLNIQRKGRIRTAIPGRIGLDVSEIDVSSLFLWVDGNTVEPLDTRIEDVTSPMINRDPCDCPPAGKDGISDLLILFSATDIIRAMGPVSKGETRRVSIRGALVDGHDFSLTDCFVIVGNPRTGDDPALFQKDAVLVALRKGYSAKDYRRVSTLFDDDFTFFFSEADIQSGDVEFTQWDREHELTATANLFNIDQPSYASDGRSVSNKPSHVPTLEEPATWGKVKASFFDGHIDGETSIVLLLIFPQGEESWTTVVPPDPAQYPGEVWYQKTATYFFYVWVGDFAFVTDTPRQTAFVVRFSETKGYWQLVGWRDDI